MNIQVQNLIETIKIENGHIYNIEWHNLRFNSSRKELFGVEKSLYLQKYITPPKNSLFRCRILYDKDIISIEYIPYQVRKIKTFKIVEADIDYRYKYSNRMQIEQMKAKALPFDEIIIEKNELITDTSIANIAFYDGKSWLTPKKPLLKGTMRAKLLSEKRLIEKDIKSEELKEFSHFALMNAMIGFQIQKNIIIESKKEKLCL
jgi:4-amino-4-deoxychorismate lyase